MGVLFLASAAFYSNNLLQAIIFDLILFYLLTISVIDFEHKIIPDELSFSLLGLGLVIAVKNPFLSGGAWTRLGESALAASAGGLFMLLFAWGGEKLFKKEALGGGAIKLMAAIGAVLGVAGLINGLLIGSFLGALVGALLLILKRKKAGETIPYGPFLCFGVFLGCLYPGWWTPFLSP